MDGTPWGPWYGGPEEGLLVLGPSRVPKISSPQAIFRVVRHVKWLKYKENALKNVLLNTSHLLITGLVPLDGLRTDMKENKVRKKNLAPCRLTAKKTSQQHRIRSPNRHASHSYERFPAECLLEREKRKMMRKKISLPSRESKERYAWTSNTPSCHSIIPVAQYSPSDLDFEFQDLLAVGVQRGSELLPRPNRSL